MGVDRDERKDLDELYESTDYLIPIESNRISTLKKRYIVVPLLCMVGFGLVYVLDKNITIGELLKIDVKREEGIGSYSIKDKVVGESNNVVEVDDYKDIDKRLQEGELLSDIVKDYFSKEYGLEVAVVDTTDTQDSVSEGVVYKVVTVKDVSSNSVYEFKYVKDVNGVTLSDTYGSALTSKLIGVKLTEYYKSELPEGSVIWVSSDSLGLHSKIDNKEISNTIINSTVEDLLSYTEEVDLFNSICVNIVEEVKEDDTYLITDYIKEYEDVLLGIAKKFEKGNTSISNNNVLKDITTSVDKRSSKSLDLEVGFLKGEQGKLNVLSYIEHKIGVTSDTKEGNYYIDWYKEIPLMGEEARNNIIGAMSIKVSPWDVLNNYYKKNEISYLNSSGDAYIPVYDTVDGIMENSIKIEKRSIDNVIK